MTLATDAILLLSLCLCCPRSSAASSTSRRSAWQLYLANPSADKQSSLSTSARTWATSLLHSFTVRELLVAHGIVRVLHGKFINCSLIVHSPRRVQIRPRGAVRKSCGSPLFLLPYPFGRQPCGSLFPRSWLLCLALQVSTSCSQMTTAGLLLTSGS